MIKNFLLLVLLVVTILRPIPVASQNRPKSLATNAGVSKAEKRPKIYRTREELVTVRTEDNLISSGLLVMPVRLKEKNPIAVIWVHGAGQNFYFPSYVKIARLTAARGYAFITVNTRMHDIGSFLAYHDEGAVRGGSYWGLSSKQTLDIAAWIAYAGTQGYKRVVLVGHSAGGPAARAYQAEKQDPRVVGLVMASVSVTAAPRSGDSELVKIASEMVAKGRGQDLLPNVPFRLSAGTYLDYARTSPDVWDFYGVETPNPAIIRIRCPLLAWFGSKEPDVGTAADLERLRRLIANQPRGPFSVDTVVVENADHLYGEQEEQVARILANWMAKLPNESKSDWKGNKNEL